jgi:predicted DNA-binding transcriptional regulator AlpA
LLAADAEGEGMDTQADGGGPGWGEPISVRIPDAVRMTGLSRSRIYQLIAAGDIEAAKIGRSTVVLVASLRSLVLANRKVPRRKA